MISARDYLVVALLAVGISGGLAVLGLLLLRHVRAMSLSTLVNASVAVSLGPVVAAVAGTSAAMFLTGHDLKVAVLAVVIAGVVGGGVALALGRRLVAAAMALRDGSAALGGPTYVPIGRLPTIELRELARELDGTHRRLVDLREREQALEAGRRSLVASVSHDLRTPLAALRAMSEALEDGVAVDPPRYLRQIRSEVDRLDALVDDLFLLSRLHAGALEPHPQPVQVGDVLSDTLAQLEPVAAAARVRLTGSAEPGLLVVTDPSQLGRALANLTHNAVRATAPGGGVELTARRTGGAVEVAVRDTCGGIAAEDLPRLFEVGWRGDGPSSREGAGLGLAVARGLVQASGGELEVRNVEGGCVFTIRLPGGG